MSAPTIDELARLGRIMYRLLAEEQQSSPMHGNAWIDAAQTDMQIDGMVDLKPGEYHLVRKMLNRRPS